MEAIEREVGDGWAAVVMLTLGGGLPARPLGAVLRAGWMALLWPFRLWTSLRNSLWASYTLSPRLHKRLFGAEVLGNFRRIYGCVEFARCVRLL